MSVECGHCERDLRGGHEKGCPFGPQTPKMRVLKKYPKARLCDAQMLIENGPWGPHLSKLCDTPQQAWADAASRISPRKP